MAMVRGIIAVPVIILMIMAAFLAVSGTAARPLTGHVWTPLVPEAAVSGDDGAMQFLRRLYLQQLRAGPSCGTNSSNGGCPRHP
ncbi:hypothetical protein C2845_PM09G07550 [Panicum miliaceum]|uniref:Uncharacterized protein n=1 Tax=Panicum miliaceum TaxID=4540 RepID=A0A3L6S2W7_PANMI|nr:hypothetical protein C2845_PM09G07550 [Panicum miliaceum]